MWQAATTHDCCPPVVPAGWTSAPCHRQRVSALAARVVDPTPAPLLGALPAIADLSIPRLATPHPQRPVLAAAVPRFILTHTFRL